MATGQDLLKIAESRIGERYVYGADVPLDDSEWHGPWDCAEFATWVVYQGTGQIYGCMPNDYAPIAKLDPYTGAWKRDVENGELIEIDIEDAIQTPGALLLLYGGGHHIVFSDGTGGTVEAMGSKWGVTRGRARGRHWTYGILIPGVEYEF